jgi:geranylgeranyl reductase family protein
VFTDCISGARPLAWRAGCGAAGSTFFRFAARFRALRFFGGIADYIVRDMRVDALVIGAGPAGSAAAIALAKAGRDVLLVDRCAFPRDKVCGDALIPDALTALDRFGLREAVLRRSRVLDGVRVHAPGGEFVDVSGECACIPRVTFDDIVRSDAVRAGARFMPGVDVRGAIAEGDAIVGADLGSAQVRAEVTLLATGAAAEPLKRFGVCHRVTPSATAARIYVRTDEAFARDARHLCISYDAAICPGYGWIFPGPDATFNVGVGYFYDGKAGLKAGLYDQRPNLRRLLQRFLDTFPPAVDVMRHAIDVTELKGAPLRTALCGSALSRRGLLILGEAAGLTYSFSGEGIGKALESGIIAAETILRGEAPETYAARIHAAFGPRFRAYKLAQDWLSNPRIANLLARRARKSPFVRRELSGLFQETADPRRLFSAAGMLRSFVTRTR